MGEGNEADAASLREAWEALDNAKHRLMDGEVEAALEEAVRAAREALVVLLGAGSVRGLRDASLMSLYEMVGTVSGEDEAWGSLILRCVKLLDEARAWGSVAPEDVEDVIACAEEVVNWVDAFFAHQRFGR